MIKYKLGLLGFLLAFGIYIPTFAQEKIVTQNVASEDTAHEEMKDNLLDNIPIVSLEGNDDLDGSAQNIFHL